MSCGEHNLAWPGLGFHEGLFSLPVETVVGISEVGYVFIRWCVCCIPSVMSAPERGHGEGGRVWLVVCYGFEDCQVQGSLVRVLKLGRLPGVKRPLSTFEAALSADSIDATHICCCIISVFLRWWKSWFRRWRWHGRRLPGYVSISTRILANNSVCLLEVSLSILWWTLAFL